MLYTDRSHPIRVWAVASQTFRAHVRDREREVEDALLQIVESGLGGRTEDASHWSRTS